MFGRKKGSILSVSFPWGVAAIRGTGRRRSGCAEAFAVELDTAVRMSEALETTALEAAAMTLGRSTNLSVHVHLSVTNGRSACASSG
jgi:hypothetical protein